eukprot:149193_1
MSMDGFCGRSQTFWTIIFALMCIIGQVSQNVALPIWFSSVPQQIDPFWIVMLSTIIFQLFFGTMVIIFDICINKNISTTKQLQHVFSYKYIIRFIVMGTTNGIAGLIITFAARKCAPFLQAILGTFNIFWVIMFRYILLSKKPSFLQFIYAMFVFLGLFVTSIPSIFGLNQSNAFQTDGNSTWKVLFPLLFALGFAPNAILCVITEDVLKQTYFEDKNNNSDFSMLSIWFINFMESSFQWIVWICFFWIDALPIFGAADSVEQIFYNLKTNWMYMFGENELCGSRCIYLPIAYNILFIVQAIGYSLMVRYSEGSSWAAIVNALITPFGAIFWFLFTLKDNGWFGYQPNWTWSNWFVLGGLFIMTPFIYLYHTESTKKRKKITVSKL